MTLLESNSISKNFGGLKALSDINLTIRAGETIGMIGPNGSGKTTFVNVASGSLQADDGQVYFLGQDVTRAKPHQLSAMGLARTFQATRHFADLTVRENMIAANTPHYRALGRASAAEEIEPVLERLDLIDAMSKKVSGLTLYDQKRLEIGMRLIAQPKLLMLDEPVGGLSPTEILQMLELLEQLSEEYTLFIIEHTMKVIFDLADRVIVLNTGMKLAEGPPEQIAKDPKVIEAYLGREDYFEETTA
jgi:ABC-type branched-subunit amino acid transport system ATPase component